MSVVGLRSVLIRGRRWGFGVRNVVCIRRFSRVGVKCLGRMGFKM